jgi:hypothetical protein
MIGTHADSRKALTDWNERQQTMDQKRDAYNEKRQRDLEPRNKKMCKFAIWKISEGDAPTEIVGVLSDKYDLSPRQIRSILRKECPEWDASTRYKRKKLKPS